MKKKHDEKQDPVEQQQDEPVVLDTELDIEFEETEFEGVSLQDKLKKLKQELKESKKQGQEYLTGWQKERASFANFRSEEEKRRSERLASMKINLLSDFLPVLDSFDMAFKNKEAWEKVDSAWRTGVEYIHSQLMSVLDTYALEIIDAIGVPFDPVIHDPIEQIAVQDQKDDHHIMEIVQKGYRSGDIIVRPAKVKVGKYENTRN